MDADLDTLATPLYVKTDDLLKAFPDQGPYRPEVGIAPKISDAEMLTLAVIQALRRRPHPTLTIARRRQRGAHSGQASR